MRTRRVPTLSFGDRLALTRKKAGFGSSEMAGKLKISRHTLTSWEGDHHRPSHSHVEKWADLTGFSLDFILNGDLEETIEKNGQTTNNNISQQALAALIAKLLMGNGGDESGQPHRWSIAELDLMPVIDLTGDEVEPASVTPIRQLAETG